MQGNNLSPSLFNGQINGLLLALNETNAGVKIPSGIVNNLAYADDIVLLAENEVDLQKLLNVVSEWCVKWR